MSFGFRLKNRFSFELISSILIDYGKVISGTFLARGLSFLSSLLIARILGTELFGMFTIFFICLSLTWQFPQGFDVAFIRYARSSSTNMEVDNYLRSNITMKIIYSLFILFVTYPFSFFVSNYLIDKPSLFHCVLYGLICGIFIIFLMNISVIFQEKEQYGFFSLVYLSHTSLIFLIIFIYYLFKLKFSLLTLLNIYLFVSFGLGIFSLYILHKKVGYFSFSKAYELTQTFHLGKWVIGVFIFYYLFQRIDLMILSRLTDFKELGIYSAAAQITMFYSLFTGAMSGIFLPKSMTAIKSLKVFKQYLFEITIPILIVESILLFIYILAPILIPLLYGNEFSTASKYLRILTIGWFFHILFLPIQYIFYALDATKLRFSIEIIKFLLVVILILSFTPYFGAIAAAFSMSFVMALNFIFSLILVFILIKKDNII